MSVLVPGPFLVPRGLNVAVTDGWRDFGSDVTARAEELWLQEKASRPKLFDGEVWSVLGYGCRGTPSPSGEVRQLELHLQRSSFRYHLLHMEEARSAATRCCMTWNPMILSVSALTITRDGCACIGQRSLNVSSCQGQWSTIPAGVLHSPDILQVLSEELHEELGADLPPLLVGSWEYSTDGECCSFEVLRTPGRGLRFRQEFGARGERQECSLEPVPDTHGLWRGELNGSFHFQVTLRHVLVTDCVVLFCTTSVVLPLAPRKTRLVQFEATARRQAPAGRAGGATCGDVEEVQLLGLFEAAPEQGWKPEVIFVLQLSLDQHELLQRMACSRDGYKEHHSVKMIPVRSGDQLRHFALTHPCTAVLVAAMRAFEEMRLTTNFGNMAGETWDRLVGAADLDSRVLARGPMSLQAGVRVRVCEGLVSCGAEVQARADELARSRSGTASWKDGQVWCLRKFRRVGGGEAPRGLEMTLQRGRYAFHCLQLQEATTARCRTELRCIADAVGVAVAALTEDNCLCFGQRSIQLEACSAMWHLVPTGMLTGDFGQGRGRGCSGQGVEPEESHCIDADLGSWLAARLDSELAVEASEVGPGCVLALAECGAEQGWTPDLILTCRLRLTGEEVLRRFESSPQALAKHSRLKCIGPLVFASSEAGQEEAGVRPMQASRALQSFLQTHPVTYIALTAIHLLLQHGQSGL